MQRIKSRIVNLNLIIIGLLLINACSDINAQIKSIRSQAYKIQKLNNEVKTDKIDYSDDNYLKEFYKNGKLKRHLIYFLEDMVSKTECTYNEQDSLIKISIYEMGDDNKDLNYSYSYKYINDTLKTMYVLDENNEVIRIGEYTYYDDGFSILEYDKDKKDDNKNLVLKKYNTKKQKISLKSYWVEGEYIDSEYNYYNDDNKLDSTLIFYGEELISKFKYTYEDTVYKKLQFTYDENNNEELYIEIVFNLKDEIISYKRYSDDPFYNNSMTYSYSYDKYGNWIEQKVLLDKELISVIKREIEYYD